MKSKIGDLLIQIISVMIGVFLGFAISNWSEGNRESEKFRSLITNIRAEIMENQKKVENVLDYHKALRDSCKLYIENRNVGQIDQSSFKGINTVMLLNSAYQTGIQTGLFNNMNLEQIQSVNEIYTRQRAYEDYANLMISSLLTMDLGNDKDSIDRIAMFLSVSMTDVVIKELQLLESYRQALELTKDIQ